MDIIPAISSPSDSEGSNGSLSGSPRSLLRISNEPGQHVEPWNEHDSDTDIIIACIHGDLVTVQNILNAELTSSEEEYQISAHNEDIPDDQDQFLPDAITDHEEDSRRNHEFDIEDHKVNGFSLHCSLRAACIGGYADIASVLLQHGAEQAWCDSDSTAFHDACSRGHDEVVRVLLDHNTEQLFDESGHTPLHMAARYGYATIVTLLLDSGAQHWRNDFGSTPLHEACRGGHADVVYILLRDGAPQLQDAYGITPKDIAIIRRYDDIVQMLDDYHENN